MRPHFRPPRWARDLPLFWKILVPFVVVILALGTVGTFVLVRNLADRAQSTLDQQLADKSLAARSYLHDREVSLVESASLAANLEGMAPAVVAHDSARVAALLDSVLALKTDLALVAITDRSGQALAQFSRSAASAPPAADAPSPWGQSRVAQPVLTATTTATSAALIGFGDHPLVALATTICGGSNPCGPVGVAIVAVDAARLVDSAGVSVYDPSGQRTASSGAVPNTPPPAQQDGFLRRTDDVGGHRAETLYAPLILQGTRVGTLGVTLRSAPAFASARSAALRLGILLFAAMVATVVIGAAVSHLVLSQVRSLLAANRALEAGDLTVRVPVNGKDELGELATGVNQMASAFEESYATLEARVEERTSEVQRLLAERTEFFTAVSHEFRTPLAVILGQAGLLGTPAVAKDDLWCAQTSGIITSSANQLLRFVEDILEIARAESGGIELAIDDVRLPPILEELRPPMTALADQHGVTLTVRCPKRLPVVRADRARVAQVVADLVDNAVKYTPRGGTVIVSAAARNGSVDIAIADTGVGVPAEAVPRLFEPFYRVPETRTQDGQPSTGLGLALVKRLVEAQAGTVTLASEPGEGSTVTITLPVS